MALEKRKLGLLGEAINISISLCHARTEVQGKVKERKEHRSFLCEKDV